LLTNPDVQLQEQRPSRERADRQEDQKHRLARRISDQHHQSSADGDGPVAS